MIVIGCLIFQYNHQQKTFNKQQKNENHRPYKKRKRKNVILS